jgi:hypothetical protein
MEALTLYLFYVAVTGGPERRVIQHLNDEKECREVLARWKDDPRYTVTQRRLPHGRRVQYKDWRDYHRQAQ